MVSVSNVTAIIGVLILFNYFVLYKLNEFLGSIAFFLTGIGLAAYGTEDLSKGIGVIIALVSIVNAGLIWLQPVKRR